MGSDPVYLMCRSLPLECLQYKCINHSISVPSYLPLWQQMESEYPAFLVQGEVLEEEGLGATSLGTLLSPKYPTEKQTEHLFLSLRQQMEYLWLDRW